jgi:ADP-ribose pyrophosphatase
MDERVPDAIEHRVSDELNAVPDPHDLHDLREQTVSSDTVYQGVFLKIRKDQARLPDGSVHVREWVVHPGASAILALSETGEVLMERQWRYPMGREYLEIPAGKIDAGETPLQTAKRELLEETGMRAAHWEPLTVIHPAIGFSNEVIHIFVARGLSGSSEQATLDHGERIQTLWMSLTDLMDRVRKGQLPDVKTQIALWHLQERTLRGD